MNADADGPARRVPHERMTAPGHLRWRNVARRPAGLPMAKSAVDKLSFMCDHVSDANVSRLLSLSLVISVVSGFKTMFKITVI